MSFFNIRFRNRREAGAIGIIGGADGPTAIFTSKDINNKKREQEKFLAFAAEQIAPCERTFEQLEEYLIEKYRAVPHKLVPHELNALKANVILNNFDHVLSKPAPLGKNPTEKEIRVYFEQDTSFYQARQYPAQKLGLELKAYKLPDVLSETGQKSRLEYKTQPGTINAGYTKNDVIVKMEMKSGYLCVCNGSEEIINDLLLYRGVSEKDIKEKSPRFIAYAYALKHFGKL